MTVSDPAEIPSTRRFQWAQTLMLAVLYSVPALVCLRIAAVADPDVWWHLRTGQWIEQHGAVPYTDSFSSFAAGKPWAAYSWLFDLLIVKLFQRLGLIGIVVYTTGMAVAITIALHRMIRRLQADFLFAVLLTAAACFCLTPLWTPRPWLLTILFFALEVDLLMQARKNGKIRQLVWLPVIFALWANLHIQFIDGLVVMALALAESVLAQRWTAFQTHIRPAWLCGVSVACVLATLANPYGWHIYKVAYDLAAQPGVLYKLSELQALGFRNASDWALLLLALASAAILARASRFSLFELTLLAFAVYVSFRSGRDLWVLVIAGSAILASGLTGDNNNRFCVKASFAPLVAVATGFIVFIGFWFMRLDNARLLTNMAENLPVRAVEVAKERGLSGPLFNDYNWGGYLIWALRLPVSIDGRAALQGDQHIDRSMSTWNAQPDWASDSDLAKAGLVIGPVKSPLSQVLRLNPHFKLVFEDKLAAVFVSSKVPFPEPVGSAEAGACASTQKIAK